MIGDSKRRENFIYQPAWIHSPLQEITDKGPLPFREGRLPRWQEDRAMLVFGEGKMPPKEIIYLLKKMNPAAYADREALASYILRTDGGHLVDYALHDVDVVCFTRCDCMPRLAQGDVIERPDRPGFWQVVGGHQNLWFVREVSYDDAAHRVRKIELKENKEGVFVEA